MGEGGRIEALNQAVRALVTLGLAGAFIWGFVFLKLISGEVFTAVVTGVISYWFAARGGEQATKAAVQAALQQPPPTPPLTVVVPPREGSG